MEFCLAAVQTSLGSDGARAAVERHFAKVEAVVREGIGQMFLFAETSHVDAMQDYDPPHATRMKGVAKRGMKRITPNIEERIAPITISSPSSPTSAVPVAPSTKRRASMRVQWQCHEELTADDVLDHFSAYGQIEELEWLEDGEKSQQSVEEVRLSFGKSGAGGAMRGHKHQIIRKTDGKKIEVKVFVKFSDNVVT